MGVSGGKNHIETPRKVWFIIAENCLLRPRTPSQEEDTMGAHGD